MSSKYYYLVAGLPELTLEDSKPVSYTHLDGNLPITFEEQLDRTIIYKDYVNLNPLVNIDVETYSGIGLSLIHI